MKKSGWVARHVWKGISLEFKMPAVTDGQVNNSQIKYSQAAPGPRRHHMEIACISSSQLVQWSVHLYHIDSSRERCRLHFFRC